MHYVFRDFEHQDIASFYPIRSGIESYIQPVLEQSRFWNIRYSRELDRFDRKVISELCWFYSEKWMRDHNPGFARQAAKGLVRIDKKVHDLYERLLATLADVLREYGIDADTTQDSDSARYEDRLEQQIAALTQAEQFRIRDKVSPSIAELASMELHQKIGGLNLKRFVDLRPYHKQRLGRFEIWMNDNGPKVYNEKISPVCLIYLKLCQSVEKVKFVPGKLESVCEKSSVYNVAFNGSPRMTFERVATRFGISHNEATRKMIGSSPRKMHFGDWLLEVPYAQRSRIDTDGHTYNQQFNAAREAVAHAAVRFANDHSPRRDGNSTLSKSRYLAALVFPDQFATDSILSDAEGRLRARLRRGPKMTYTESGGENL
jgi:hypothetical protein